MLAGAQDSQELATLEIALWPEYDRPGVLVIYRAELPAEMELPAEVTLPVPARAGQPHAVATAAGDGQLINAPFETRLDGEWLLVVVEADTRTIWLEYYDQLSIEGQNRRFTFEWPGTVAVGSLNYEVQEPLGARDIRIEPVPSGRREGNDGLSYAQGTLGAVGQGERRRIEVAYARASDQLSADLLRGPAFNAEPAPVESAPADPRWPLAVAAISAAAAIGGAYLFWHRRRSQRVPKRRRRPSAPERAERRFCHQCGQAVKPADRFCRRCGTELRR